MATLKKILGSMLCIASSFFIVMSIADIARGGDGKTDMGVLWGLLIFFSGTFIAGVRLLRSGMQASRPRLHDGNALEVAALKAARTAGGTIGPAELAASAGVPFSRARDALEALRKQGACHVVISDAGAELYRFPDLALPPGAAAQTPDLIDGH